MEKQDPIFVDGMIFKKPHENAPEFVKGAISIKVEELKKWLDTHGEGKEWLNVDLKKSKKGSLYLQLNTYNPNKEDEGIKAEDIPFD